MSQFTAIGLIFVLLVPLWILLRRDFVSGLAYAVCIMVSCTSLLRIDMMGVLPELTIQRLITLSLLWVWLRKPKDERRLADVPLAKNIGIWMALALISMLGTVDLVFSTKRFLDFVLDIFLFYALVATSLKDRESAFRILRAAWAGLTIVAVLAVLEKYSHFNVVDHLFPGSAIGENGKDASRDVRATYQHRILLGTAMAMAWPLALGLTHITVSRLSKLVFWLSAGIMMMANYFTMSRGPWMASAFAGVAMFAFGSGRLRRQMLVLGFIGVVAVLSRPGVYATVGGYAHDTQNADSLKGGSFLYRFELWRIAFTEISQSPWRMAFGYGPGAGGAKTFEWSLSYRDKDWNIDSWDNDYAYTLYQYGALGLLATLALYPTMPWRLLKRRQEVPLPERDLLVCVGASTVALAFMMMDVHVYARQLYYLFWIFAAAGFVLVSKQEPVPAWDTEQITGVPESNESGDATLADVTNQPG